MTNIYVLCDRDGCPRYIGKTTYELSKRLREHVSEAKTAPERTTHKNQWIRKCLANGYEPMIQLVEEVDGTGDDEECFWIFVCRKWGTMKLTNGTEGGDGGRFSAEARKKLSEAMKGKRNSLGHKHSEATRRNQSERLKGKKPEWFHTPDAIAKMAASKVGKPSPRKGVTLSAETKAKLKANWTPEKRAQFSKATKERMQTKGS